MAYTVEPKGHPQIHRPSRILTAINSRLIDRLTTLNGEVANSISIELLTDAQDCNLVHILTSGVFSQRSKRKRPVTWGINIFAGTLQTRAHLYRLLKTQGQRHVRVEQPSLRPVETCLVCHGAGYVPPMHHCHPRRVIPASLVSNSDLRRMVPPSVLASSRLIADKLDELRGRGLFDGVMQHIERSLLTLRQSIFHYTIDIQSRIEVGRRLSIVAPLGVIRLAPHVVIDGEARAFSSRWEAAKVTGRRRAFRLTHFQACEACLGLGIRAQWKE